MNSLLFPTPFLSKESYQKFELTVKNQNDSFIFDFLLQKELEMLESNKLKDISTQ
jgi:hypothetical protein